LLGVSAAAPKCGRTEGSIVQRWQILPNGSSGIGVEAIDCKSNPQGA
jgi:hypothetical protein